MYVCNFQVSEQRLDSILRERGPSPDRAAADRQQVKDPTPKAAPPPTTKTTPKDSTSIGIGIYAALFLGIGLAWGALQYIQAQKK